MMGASEGFVFSYDGGCGRSPGRLACAREIAACTSGAARSTLRLRLKVSVIVVSPSTLFDMMDWRPGICMHSFSRGDATVEAIVSGLDPG